MAPCRTVQADGGGIYPASEGPPEGKCEVQRAFPDKAPVQRPKAVPRGRGARAQGRPRTVAGSNRPGRPAATAP